MKYIFRLLIASVLTVAAFSSCREEDDFSDSMFDTSVAAVDQSLATAPFDQWLYDTFVLPYNTQIEYRLNLLADLQYQLAPSDYKKAQLLAHFIKYLFYDVYNKYGEKDAQGNELFMKLYGPRLIHFLGSKEYSPTTQTETLGYASGGVKITLNNINGMKWSDQNLTFNDNDIWELNKAQFHTMHHEFSHILQQTKLQPSDYALVTPNSYDAMTWQENDSTKAHGLGYVTHYCMSSPNEDFVEVLSCTITDTDYTWMVRIIDGCLNGGIKEGDKARVYAFIRNLGIDDATLDDPDMYWNKFEIYEESVEDETGAIQKRYVIDRLRDDAREQYRKNDMSPTYTKVTKPASFRDFLDNWVTVDPNPEIRGINAMLTKFEKANGWYSDKFLLDAFKLRQEVRERQASINEFIQTLTIYDL